MRLGIVSDCIHFTTPSGSIGTENHILLRQLEAISMYFSETLICCPFAKYDAGKVISTYNDSSIQFIPLPVVGGNKLKDKIQLLTVIPAWWRAFRKIDEFSDVVYQRFPNNLNIPGFVYFWLKKKKVFATYTGTWNGYTTEPFTYKLQRWMLRNSFRGPVWVYTNDHTHSSRLHAGFSPSYSLEEWHEETAQVEQRIARLHTNKPATLRMITVGSLIDYKNQLTILKAAVLLQQQHVPFHLSIVGDGAMKAELESFINDHALQGQVQLLGKKTQTELRELYRQHDVVVQAPLKEGFGKVPIEAFFHGVVPVISRVGVSEMIVGNNERGFLFDPANAAELAKILSELPRQSLLISNMILNGRAYAQSQTLEGWAKEYFQTISNYYRED